MLAAVASAQPADSGLTESDGQTRRLQIADFFKLESVGDPRVSPDGQWVAFTVRTLDLKKDAAETRLWMVPVAGGEAIPMTAPGSTAGRPRWSRDGKYLGFLSNRVDKKQQVFVLDRRGGEAIQLTEVEQGVQAFEWSPDGKRLVLVVEDPKPKKKDAEEGGAESDEKEVPDPWVIDRLQFKDDEEGGYLDRLRNHLYVFDLKTKETRQITFGDFEDSEPAWSPDGRSIVFVSNRTEEPDSNYNTDLWLVDPDAAESGQAPARITTGPGSDRSPTWHPDGSLLAYITTTRPEIVDFAQTKVAVIEADGSRPTILTEELDRTARPPRFSPDGGTVYFRIDDHGSVPLATAAPDGGGIARAIAGRRRVEAFDIAPDGTIVAVISEANRPGEIFALAKDGTPLERLTHLNDEALAGVRFARAEKITATSPDGTPIEAFVDLPPDFQNGRRYPTILWPHGGPMGQHDWGWNFTAQLIAANGYVVVRPNPRGSTGYGQDFCLAIWANWGEDDLQDVLAAVGHVIELGWADPDRLGVAGWSYGGIMTNYVITTTDRFKAAMSGASGGLWVANYGHDQYQRWYEKEFGLPWESREVWERLSPFNRVEKITTPTLWMGGEKDWNVPVSNSEMMYQSMRRLGRDTMLVVYPGQHHGIRRPSYVKDMYERWISWFDKHLKAGTEGGNDP